MSLDFLGFLITKYCVGKWLRTTNNNKAGCMSTSLYALRAKNVATTIATLQGMIRSKKTREAKAIEKIILELQEKLHSLKVCKK
jgi:hypothetical protein